MSEQPARKIPGHDHPITITPNPRRVLVTVAGRVIVDTKRALTLWEAAYPPVQYVPREDVHMAALAQSTHTSQCPYKGEASYYSIPAGGARSINAVWSYEEPYDNCPAIRGHLAFFPDGVDAIEEVPA